MENKLDKYFRDNLHDRRFEMKEEYWLGAEKLLDEQDRRRKRRVGFWWFGGGSAMVVLMLLGWWLLGKNDGANPSAPTSQRAEKTPATSGQASPIFEEKNGEKTATEAAQVGSDGTAKTVIPEGKSTNVAKQQAIGNPTKETSKPIENQRIANKSTRSPFSKTPTLGEFSGILRICIPPKLSFTYSLRSSAGTSFVSIKI